MKKFKDKLADLETACVLNFEATPTGDDADHDAEYIKIREDVLALYADAQKTLSVNDVADIKAAVIDFLCRNCGCHLDMDVLEKNTPAILSQADFDYITSNSALSRWF